MVMTREDRIELLKKAREAKALKKAEADKSKPVPVKGRPKKVAEENRTLDIVDDVLQEKDVLEEPKKIPAKPKTKPKPAEVDEDVEVVEKEIIEKIKKPKRRILRRIIKQEYSDEDTEEEYEEVVIRPPKNNKPVKVVQKQAEHTEAPKQLPKQYNNPFFNY